MSETADRVKKIVVEHLGVEAEKVTEEAACGIFIEVKMASRLSDYSHVPLH